MNITKKAILAASKAYSKLPEHRKEKNRKLLDKLRAETDEACKAARRPKKTKFQFFKPKGQSS